MLLTTQFNKPTFSSRLVALLLLLICFSLHPINQLQAQIKSKVFNSNGKNFKHKLRAPKENSSSVSSCFREANRSIDGTCNNLSSTDANEWGAADITLLREMPAAYGNPDFYNDMGGNCRLTPRAISNLVVDQAGDIPSPRGLSSMVFTWGQFLDHDIDLTPEDHTEYHPILLPSNEPLFTSPIPFFRSAVYPGTGTNSDRQQQNLITSWIDASQVYGSEDSRAAWLRTFSEGKLKTSDGDLLPYNTLDGSKDAEIDPNAPSMAGDDGGTALVFVAGDVRANEQPGLTALHTLFVREHNRLCDQRVQAGFRNDEANYQFARKRVGAYMQAITYEAFLPALGIELSNYRGYRSDVKPDISNLFASAAYRLGHTMVTSEIPLIDTDCEDQGSLSLLQSFFNPTLMDTYGLEPMFQGLAAQTQQKVDSKIVDDLRNFLFPVAGSPDPFGLDLASLNIQRGRDHGLPDYNSVRMHYTGEAAEDFNDISSDANTQAALTSAYGSVYDMDVWVGLLAEDPLPGSSVGLTLHTILAKQFENLRNGDYYYYMRDPAFSASLRDQIRNTTLSNIILRNTDIDNLQNDIFFARDCGASTNPPGGGGNNGPGRPGGGGPRPIIDTGTSSTLASNVLQVAPNPTQDLVQLNLQLDNLNSVPVLIKVQGANGKVLQKVETTVEGGRLQKDLSLKALSKGVYFIQVEIDNQVFLEKVIVL